MYKHVDILTDSSVKIKKDLKNIKDLRIRTLAKSNYDYLQSLIKQFQLTKAKSI